MSRRVLVLACLSVLVATAALAQPLPPLLTSTPVSRSLLVSLDAVQAQVDAILIRAAASKDVIAEPIAQPPLPLLLSTPIPRR